MTKRGAILYDTLRLPGGAERVALTLARAMPDSTLCVGGLDDASYWRDYVEPERVVSLGLKAEWAPWLALRSLNTFSRRTRFLQEVDWVIYSGSYAPVAVRNSAASRNVYYCHTIPRFVYDLRDYYLSRLSVWQKPALLALIDYVRPRYESAIAGMDRVIANSVNVQKRLKRYMNIQADVVYPPVTVDAYEFEPAEGYYLSTARLESYKRVSLLIRAFLRMPEKKLVVASGGSEERYLIDLAAGAPNIHFAGWCGDRRLRRLIQQSIATIYLPKDEDFGLSPVESMAAGKPVIGVSEGGLKETIVHEHTGFLLPVNPTQQDVIDAVVRMDEGTALSMRAACESRAEKFSGQEFIKAMKNAIGLHYTVPP